ncbi:MAG: chitobiase/beta-hexosaminidase C-terminal domain-containing protein, partial [Bacteroidales bacterium]|nr:chitobiase/beta-hexosaminidase C-terminal domain-containing protein [Bacteroidales bacterium]
MRTFAMLFFMALFTQIAQAQVYMHNGTQTVPGTGSLYFYDSGGPSSPDFWWEKWYSHNENATLTFKNGDSPILVTFNQFTAYDGNTGANIGQFALRVNDDHLYVYEGDKVDNNKLIVDLTGTIEKSFSIMANGPITFKFVSNASYRDEGWAASVSTADTYTVQQPVMMKETCDDVVVLLPTAPNATLYYTTDGSNPTTSSTEYTAPFAIDLDAETASVTVKAIAVVDTYTSATASNTFTHADQRPTPGVPTISIDGNMVHITPAAVPPGLNETYNVRYTTDGSEPSANNGTLITAPWDPIEWHTPNTTFKAVTVAVSCPDKVSSVVSVNFGNVTVPTPVITFNADGTATIACSLTGASIFYTLDGSTPTTSSGNFGTTEVTTAALTPGTTVKAIAHYEGSGYDDSQVASAIYVPAGGSTVSGGVVFLDDREDHTWSYYSDGDQPIHSLKPADVKITYKGFGENTMTSTNTDNMPANSAFDADVAEDQVAVNVGEAGNQFIYLKTLENANEDGSGNYPYTMIANPFQVRPNNGASAVESATRNVYISTSRSSSGWWSTTYGAGTLTVNYYDAANQPQTYTATINQNNTPSTTITVKSGTVITFRITRTSSDNSVTYVAQYDNNTGDQISTGTANSGTAVTNSLTAHGTLTINNPEGWRGFYAWRIKSLSSGLTISGKVVGDHVYPGELITFETTKEDGNEVEFEALWARAWVNSSSTSERATNSGNYKNAYERNFKVGASLANYDYPVTFTTLLPDGSGTISNVTGGTYSCNSDVKFENMTLNATSINGNNHNLHIGRGVSNGTNNVANSVYGYNGATGSISAFNVHIESGRYANAYLLYNDNTTQVSSSNIWNMVLGSDYDRAKKDNSKLIITGPVEASYRVSSSSTSAKINIVGLSGTFGANSDNNELYMGYENRADANTAATPRFLEVLGGEYLGGISGGIENGVTATTHVLTMRIKGGTIHRYVYGAGQFSAAIGTRKAIITGGTFDAWVAGGCYGTDANGNAGNTNGDSYIYFGGDANMTNAEGVFGGGYGRGDADNNKYTINKSFVVIADEAQIAGNVYGGGNKGYNTDDAEVYVLGGGENTIKVSGSVFGGANLARSEAKTTVTMKDGTVTGSLYGGANASGAVAGLGTVNVSGGTVTNVFGGGKGSGTSMAAGTKVNVSGGTINNNVYGGGELGTVTGNTEVTVSGGTMNDVFGAGKGGASNAQVSGNTVVNISGGTIANVFGGGEAGDVAGTSSSSGTTNIVVTLNGNHNQNQQNRRARLIITSADGTVNQTIYWERYAVNAPHIETLSVPYDSEITVTYYYNPTYYPNGLSYNIKSEDGTVTYVNQPTQPTSNNYEHKFTIPSPSISGDIESIVNINGGNISGNVYGGGKMGKTDGAVTTNVTAGNIRGNVFGGAEGEQKKVFVTGMRTVNMTGGHVYGNVYGGSRNANDGNDLDLQDSAFSGSTETGTICVTNISGGIIDQNVYAAGYYGNTFGSVYAFIGKNAIEKAPHKEPTTGINYKVSTLYIHGTVWAGGDWGTFSGSFGGSTVSGNSNIYVDGTDYETTTTQTSNAQYMNIGGSILGCGTSCDAGKNERTIIIRNYGTAIASGSKAEPFTKASRDLMSIQRAKILILDNASINYNGQGKINSLSATEKYAIYEIANTGSTLNTEDLKYGVRLVNGSSLFLNAPVSQISNFISASCTNVYTAAPTTDYPALAPGDLNTTDNKVRVNGGNYVEVKYGTQYCMLSGYAHMMVSTSEADAT